MARHIRLFGLASLVVTDDPVEIAVFLQHPGLDREYAVAGPLINRIITGSVKRQFDLNGRYWLSLRSRHDPERKHSQLDLRQRLGGFSVAASWSPDVIEALGAYVAGAGSRDAANAALAYGAAFPFRSMTPGGDSGFNIAQYRQIFRLYRRINRARSPISPRGIFIRMNGGHIRARNALLRFMGGDPNGLHSVAVTLDNAITLLENMREAFDERRARKSPGLSAPANGLNAPFPWAEVRTAPVLVLRQARAAVMLPHVAPRVPANTLVMMHMRDSLESGAPGGYELAAKSWSYCPATRYIHAFFGAVWQAALDCRTKAPNGNAMAQGAAA